MKNIDQCRGVFHWASQRHLHFAPVSFSHTYTPTHSVRGDKTRAKIPQKHTVHTLHTVHTHTLRGDLPANEQKPKKNPKKFKGKMNINSKTFIGLFEIKKKKKWREGREKERGGKKRQLCGRQTATAFGDGSRPQRGSESIQWPTPIKLLRHKIALNSDGNANSFRGCCCC